MTDRAGLMLIKCPACDGHGWTPLFWHGTRERTKRCACCGAEEYRQGDTVGGIHRSLCDRCYGLGELQPNEVLFYQRVGKTLLWRFKQAGYQSAQAIVDRMAEHIGYEHAMMPKAVFDIKEGVMQATVLYPSALVKRVARDVSRGRYHDDGTIFRKVVPVSSTAVAKHELHR